METKQTALHQFKKHLDNDVALGLTNKEMADRHKWYIDTYFLSLEKEQIMGAFDKGYSYALFIGGGEQYYNETYGN